MSRLLRFPRVRLEAPEGGPNGAALALCFACLAEGGELQVVERLAVSRPWDRLVERIGEAEDRLAALVRELAPRVSVRVGVELLSEDARPEPVGDALLVVSSRPGPTAWPELDSALASGWSLLVPGTEAPDRLVLLLAEDAAAAGVPAPLLRRVVPEERSLLLLHPARERGPVLPEGAVIAELLEVARLEVATFSPGLLSDVGSLSEQLASGPAPAVLVPAGRGLRSVLATLDVARHDRATLVLLAWQPPADTSRWVVSDLVAMPGGVVVGAMERVGALGLVEAPPTQVAIEQGGVRSGPHPVQGGQLVLPDAGSSHVALASAEHPDELRVLAPVRSPSGEPIHLLPLDGDEVSLPQRGSRCWGVRLDPAQPLAALQDKARELGLEALVDAGAVLQDGSPSDLPAEARTVRAGRVAARLAAAGFPVAGQPTHASDDRLACLAGAEPTTATRVEVEWDNGRFRRRLVQLFDEAAESICLQSYQVQDDPAVRQLELALARAAARGVAVRVLADAVWSGRGSLESVSPVLGRLAAAPGVAVRLVRPFAGLPGLSDLKRRDHRKLVLVDGQVGIVGGRNLGDPYLLGFDEVPLWSRSPWRDVPWLDASAEVEGPVVTWLVESFLQAWEPAVPLPGSSEVAPLRVRKPGPPGSLPVRLVRHEGLEDAHALELYRELFDGAQERLTIVNTFPLQFELLAALSRALERGVQVRVLVGNVRPMFLPTGARQRQGFPGGGLRDLATVVIHGRLDELVQRGASVHELSLPARVGWDPALGEILPHVHAKCVSMDGRVFAVGSANLDITAAYWESEVMLVVEDAAACARFDAALETLLQASPRMDPDDPAWREQAGRRAWISRNWPAALS